MLVVGDENISVVVLGLFGGVLPAKAIPDVLAHSSSSKSAFICYLYLLFLSKDVPFHSSTFATRPVAYPPK